MKSTHNSVHDAFDALVASEAKSDDLAVTLLTEGTNLFVDAFDLVVDNGLNGVIDGYCEGDSGSDERASLIESIVGLSPRAADFVNAVLTSEGLAEILPKAAWIA